MKSLLLCGLALSISAFAANQGSGYAPNDGTANPGNPGTFTTPKAGMGKAAPASTGTGTNIEGSGSVGTGSSSSPVVGSEGETNIQTGNADPNVEVNENLERSNTSATPIPADTTLQGSGSTQTGPYQTGKNKQSQESSEEEIDYRTKPGVNHSDDDASENL